MAEAVGIQNIGQIAVLTKEQDRAVAFYRDVLGLRFLFSAGPTLAFFDCGGVRLMLESRPSPEVVGSSILYFRVPDIRQAHQAMSAKGAQFVDQPHLIAKMPDHELWMAFFRDSEGNLLALMSEVPLK